MKDIFVARQPIFDQKQRIVAYELLYRSDGDTVAAGELGDEKMSSSVLVNGVLGMGLSRLTDGHTAFINFSGEMLSDGTAELLDPNAVVLEVLESVEPTPELVEQCRALVDQGYRLALDDFVYDDKYRELLWMAEFVKVDVTEAGDTLEEQVEKLKPFDVKLLAEKVEDQETHARCAELGFEFFQGYHYFRPETVRKKDAESQTVSIIRLMNLLQDPNAIDRHIEEAFKADPALTYKLLRIVNSAAMGGRGVESITHAMRLLGRDPLYRWLALLLVSTGKDGGDVRIEIIKASLLRGRMCEAASDAVRNAVNRNLPSGGAMFLVGLFAQIDQLLGTPLVDVLADIDITADVREALLERKGNAGAILQSAEAYAEADWEAASEQFQVVGGDPETLAEIYLDALTWAGDKMTVHMGDTAEAAA